MKKPNYISGLIIIIIAGFFYSQTFDFPQLDSQLIGADFMPRVYCIMLILLGCILLIQTYRDKEEADEQENTMKYSIGAMFFVILYVIVIPYIGFYISTFLLVLGLLLFSKVKNKILLIAIPVGTSLFIYVFFQILLKVSIPMGTLFS
ncbi:tripartite tricarboxylate transporter TctB family protein [Planococcus sp. 4-30]|uniref:tripartite tricarboxylate transporter TctB family protein n=1 Tax=Planococcus sp. 4-30 TaxID=2874583 RepID=UPI001CC0205A|nr:tripartite tricarboxylate transporter TctB family protein [Planococcus sp. 4-30]